MMLAFLSTFLMMFLDRLIVAQISTAAMSAATTAGLVTAIFQGGFISLTAIAEVFVGQYNGAGKQDKVSSPVWQMLWFSLASILFFWPLAFWSGPLFLGRSEWGILAQPYYFWLMLAGPLCPAIHSVNAFFVGIGKAKTVTFCTILANLVNLVLNVVLVLGIPHYWEGWGLEGAAIATALSCCLQFGILMGIFLKRPYRQTYHTHQSSLDLTEMGRCLSLGIPPALGQVVEISAWALLALMMAAMGEPYMSSFSIGHSIFVVFYAGLVGLQKGVIAVAANFLGGGKKALIGTLAKNGLRLHLFMLIFLSLPLLFYPQWVIQCFLDPQTSPEIWSCAKKACLGVWLCYSCEGIYFVLSGILTAGGDTRFVAATNCAVAWIFGVLPVYIGICLWGWSAITLWILMCGYGLVNALLFSWRYLGTNWQRAQLV